MAKVIRKCPTCHKTAETKGELKVGSLSIRTYTCGHSETVMGVSLADEDTLNITSMDGKRPFPYQIEGGRFIENSNGRCLIADDTGLGKTVQAQMFLVAHPEARPFIAFVKARLKTQWFKEGVRWGDMFCQVVDSTTTQLIPGFDGYIVPYTTAWRMGMEAIKTKAPGQKKASIEYRPIPGQTLADQLEKCKVKTVVLDECQLIKNEDSKQTKCVQNCCRLDSIKHVIALSATPIKNNAAEYFPVLNILRPDKFPNKNQYVYGWCDTYFDGYKSKTGGIKSIDKFMDFTKDFIIRRLRKDVLPDLPMIFRQNSFCDLGDMVEEEYKKTLKEFNDFYDDGPGENAMAFQSNILAYLSKMRHLTGLSKIDPVCEFVEEFITTTDRKLAIFTHHIDVAAILQAKLSNMAKEWPAEWGKGILSAVGVDPTKADEITEMWRGPDYRICILSTLASGEGLNLQFCSDCIMMERQWNPANEEQAEGRFPRPGSTADKIMSNYFVAVGTVDEFFSELVEKKRSIVAGTMDGKKVAWDQSSLVRELAQVLREKGGQKWGW